MSKGLTDAKRKAIRKYDAANTKQIHLKLNLKSDADVLERLAQAAETAEGMQGYIKRLIRQDIEEHDVPVPVKCLNINNGQKMIYYCGNCEETIKYGELVCPCCNRKLAWKGT